MRKEETMSKYVILKDENSGNKILASLPDDKELSAGDVVLFRRDSSPRVGTSLSDSFTPASEAVTEYLENQFKQTKSCEVVGRYTSVETWEESEQEPADEELGGEETPTTEPSNEESGDGT